jgi:hypothetical protein
MATLVQRPRRCSAPSGSKLPTRRVRLELDSVVPAFQVRAMLYFERLRAMIAATCARDTMSVLVGGMQTKDDVGDDDDESVIGEESDDAIQSALTAAAEELQQQ